MKIKPTQKQLDFLDWEFGVFFHFRIRSFFPGHTDWDGKPMPASAFNPKKLDCKQWIRTIKKAGAKYAILTCKHHDGFANWQSKFSDYSVAQSQWEGGKGDVVDNFVKACRQYDIKVGLYYSPAQWGGTVKFENPVEYDNYFINQISELLSNYGQIDYLWFDGCGSENHEYDKARIIHTIRTLQPGIRIFSMWDPDTRWVGNEDCYADIPNINTVEKADFSIFTDEARSLGGVRYLPAECDMRMRTAWFDCEANADTIKSVDELLGIYEYSVGRGANLLLNIGPDCDGLIPEPDAKRILEFGEALCRRYGNSLPFGAPVKKDNLWSISAKESKTTILVDTAVIEEDITEGESVREFKIYANLPTYGKKYCIYCGSSWRFGAPHRGGRPQSWTWPPSDRC
jgi:alpha-L-fucosidase